MQVEDFSSPAEMAASSAKRCPVIERFRFCATRW